MSFSIKVIHYATGKTMDLRVRPSDTVYDLKLQIHGLTDQRTPGPEEQELSLRTEKPIDQDKGFLGEKKYEKLDDHQTLAHYAITEGSEIDCAFGMQVFVKVLRPQTLTPKVRPTTTVKELKDKVQAKEGIQSDLQRLIFSGRQLEDSYTLRECNVTKESTFHLLLRFRFDGIPCSQSQYHKH